MTPEGKVKIEVKKVLKSMPDCWWYMPVSNGMGRVGCPDFLVCYRGKFVAIETKAPGRAHTVTPNQQREIDTIHAAQGRAIVLTDVAQLVELLAQIDGELNG